MVIRYARTIDLMFLLSSKMPLRQRVRCTSSLYQILDTSDLGQLFIRSTAEKLLSPQKSQREQLSSWVTSGIVAHLSGSEPETQQNNGRAMWTSISACCEAELGNFRSCEIHGEVQQTLSSRTSSPRRSSFLPWSLGPRNCFHDWRSAPWFSGTRPA